MKGRWVFVLAATAACGVQWERGVAGARATAEAAEELPTPSFALARITRRDGRPDGLMQRMGTGRGVTIYIFDGGIDARHPEVAGRVRKGFDAFPKAPAVCNGHGLAVAGAAAGLSLGAAPEATVVDVKVIDCATRRGTIAGLVAAARWVVEDHRAHPGQVSVVNWSLSVDTTGRIAAIDEVIAAMSDAGMLVVVSAGNYSMDACRISPANSGSALVVGASSLEGGSGSWHDVRTQGTAFGPCVDIFAPGDSVPLPAFEGDRPVTTPWKGTSMAAAYVSGAAAVVLQRGIGIAGIRDVLMNMARPAVTEAGIAERPRGLLLYMGPSR